MSIRLGIYDFFAYTIPGGLYLLAIFYLVIRLTPVSFDLMQVNIIHLLIFSVVSYLAGLIFDPLAKKLWYGRFETKNLLLDIITELNNRNDHISFPHIKTDWYILLAYIKRQHLEIAVEIERLNAIQIMLRNVSFALLFYAILPIVDLLEYGFSIWQGLVTLGCLLACYSALKQALKFDRWFYLTIYETIAALKLKPEHIPVRFSSLQVEIEDDSQPQQE